MNKQKEEANAMDVAGEDDEACYVQYTSSGKPSGTTGVHQAKRFNKMKSPTDKLFNQRGGGNFKVSNDQRRNH